MMKEIREYGKFNGCLPSPPDARDYRIARLVPKAPVYLPGEFILLRPAEIKDQGDIGSCVGHTLASSREIGEALQKHICEFSPGYIYANREGHSHFDEGMIPREAIDSLMKKGVPKLQLFPYNDTYEKLTMKLREVKSACDIDAEPNRISAYARLYTAHDVKTALLEVGAVPVVYDLYESFSTALYDGIVPTPNQKKENWIGGHMMLIIGWKKIAAEEHWIVLNSWGKWWGDRGLCYIPIKGYDFSEAWSLTDGIFPARESTFKTVKFSIKPKLYKQVSLDGISFVMPIGVAMKNNRIMIPLRFFSESFGCYIRWEEAEKRITIISEHNDVMIEIVMTINEKRCMVNGEEKEMDVEPYIVDGFTMAPLRFITENLNCTVDWDDETCEATVTRNDIILNA